MHLHISQHAQVTKTPFSTTVFNTLSHSVVHFVASSSSKKGENTLKILSLAQNSRTVVQRLFNKKHKLQVFLKFLAHPDVNLEKFHQKSKYFFEGKSQVYNLHKNFRKMSTWCFYVLRKSVKNKPELGLNQVLFLNTPKCFLPVLV